MVTQAPNLDPYQPTDDGLDKPVDDRLSSAQKASPKLSQRMLTVTLIVMMAIPRGHDLSDVEHYAASLRRPIGSFGHHDGFAPSRLLPSAN